jgi:hypothetical protein
MRTLQDEPWQFQLSLEEEFSTTAPIANIRTALEEVKTAQGAS